MVEAVGAGDVIEGRAQGLIGRLPLVASTRNRDAAVLRSKLDGLSLDAIPSTLTGSRAD